MRLRFSLITAFSLFAFNAHGQNLTPMRDVIEAWQADHQSLERAYAHVTGTGAIQREETFLHTWEQRLRSLDFDHLDVENRIDWLLLRQDVTHELARLERLKRERADSAAWLPFREDVEALLLKRQKMEKLSSEQAAAVLAKIPGQIKALNPGLGDSAKAPNKQALTAEKAMKIVHEIEGLKRNLQTWAESYQGFVPEFTWWVKKPWEDAAGALDGYAKQLREEVAKQKGDDNDPLLGVAVGADRLRQELMRENIAYTPEELITLANKEFAWCEERMKENAREMGCGDDWKKALEQVKNDYAAPGTQEDMVREQGRQSIAFVKSRDLVTIPPLCEELWNTSMVGPDGQKTLPYVAYGGQNILVAYAHEAMKQEDKLMSMRGNNLHFLRVVVPHELVPGHHLQKFQEARHRTWRREFGTPFYVEGWALYWEMRLWDLKYPQTPADRIGFLFWKMHRCARIIVTLNYHLGTMKPEDMVKFLVERVGHETLGAKSEVRRYIGSDYGPLYQCGYLLGGLQFRALHEEIVGGGRMTEKAFHDRVLTEGPIPIEFIRAALLGQELRRDHQPQWRFAEKLKR